MPFFQFGLSPTAPPPDSWPAQRYIAQTGIMRAAETRGIRFQPDETPAPTLSLGLGLQVFVLSPAGIILSPTIMKRAGGASESYLSWAAFATVAICGATVVLHAIRSLRIGAGYLVVM